MKVRVYNAILDNGDGSRRMVMYKSLEEMKKSLGIEEPIEEMSDGATVFDKYSYPVEISIKVFDTDGYEVVEA